MTFLLLTLAVAVFAGAHRAAGPTMRRHQAIVRYYWMPAFTLLAVGAAAAVLDPVLSLCLLAAGAAVTALWVGELIQPSIAYKETRPCIPRPRNAADSSGEMSSPSQGS